MQGSITRSGVVRAENLVHGSDQQGCSPGRPAVMITDHVPAVRVSPDHAWQIPASYRGLVARAPRRAASSQIVIFGTSATATQPQSRNPRQSPESAPEPEIWARARFQLPLTGGRPRRRQQLFFIAKGRREGSITGRFRGPNFPRREGAEGLFRPDFRAVIAAGDGATIMVEWHGYGRAYPAGRRPIVGALFHLADREPYRRLNDVVCVRIGEVRAPAIQASPDPILSSMSLS